MPHSQDMCHDTPPPPSTHTPTYKGPCCLLPSNTMLGCLPPPAHMQLVYSPMDTLPTALEAEEELDTEPAEAPAAAGGDGLDLLGDTRQEGHTTSSSREGGSLRPQQQGLDGASRRRGRGSALEGFVDAETLSDSSCRCDSGGSLLLDSSDALSVTSSDSSMSGTSSSSRGSQQQAGSQQQPKKRGRKKKTTGTEEAAAGHGEGITCLDLCTSSDSEVLGTQQQQMGSQVLMELDVRPQQKGRRACLEDPAADGVDEVVGDTQKPVRGEGEGGQALECSGRQGCAGDCPHAMHLLLQQWHCSAGHVRHRAESSLPASWQQYVGMKRCPFACPTTSCTAAAAARPPKVEELTVPAAVLPPPPDCALQLLRGPGEALPAHLPHLHRPVPPGVHGHGLPPTAAAAAVHGAALPAAGSSPGGPQPG